MVRQQRQPPVVPIPDPEPVPAARTVERVLGRRTTRRGTQYLVKFVGLPEHEAAYVTPDQVSQLQLQEWRQQEAEATRGTRQTTDRTLEPFEDDSPTAANVRVFDLRQYWEQLSTH